MNPCIPPEIIKNDNLLCRGVFSEGRTELAEKGKLVFDIFKTKHSSNPILVDCFGFCSDKDLTNIQDEAAKLRPENNGKKQRFHGWFQIKTEKTRRNGREVRLDKIKNNPYHTEISELVNMNGKNMHPILNGVLEKIILQVESLRSI